MRDSKLEADERGRAELRQQGPTRPTKGWMQGGRQSWLTLREIVPIIAGQQMPYGLRKRSNSSSSCLLSEARTRMCWATVPEMPGEKPSGVLWQREQFC